ncbi:MAG TPA: hypothetical protein VFQ13_10210 [Anaerolineales bacterium]|nr:hypothetical protein [Anaerolineales bacterium]
MKNIIIKIYRFLLQFYPAKFRSEFEEQMLLDFSDMASDARKKRGFAFASFCLHELVDFPLSLLVAHYKEGRMFKVLRSQPLNYGLRGALGFGLAFGLAILIGEFVALKLWVADDSIIGLLQVYFYDRFHTEHGLEVISWIPSALSSLATGLFLGVMFAFLFANRSTYRRYILATMLCWFLHDAVRSILMHSANLWFFLGDRDMTYFSGALSVLSGASLGLIFYVARSEKQHSTHLLVMSAVGYPVIAYLYLQLLFRLSIIETPWLGIALTLLIIIYIAGVFFMAVKSESTPKIPWLVVIGAITYLLAPYAGYYLAYLLSMLIDAPPLPSRMPVGSPDYWRLMLSIALEQSIYGILFGLFIGIAWGLQRKNNPPQLLA